MRKIYLCFLVTLFAQVCQGQCWSRVATAKSPGYANHTLAVASDSTLWAFGDNSSGQLGDGTTTTRSLPVQVGMDKNWVYVAATGLVSFGIKSDGTLWSWGENQYYALGNGTNVDQSVPTQVGTDTNWKTVSASFMVVVALKTDGTIWRWGSDGYANGSPYGMSSPLTLSVPTQLGTDTDWMALERGNTFTMALKTNGSRWGYGALTNGVAGTGVTQVGSSTLIPLDAGPWKSIAVGGTHALGIRLDGSLWSWGTNSGGQVGNGTNTNSVDVPALVENTHTWKMISTGYNITSSSEVSFAIRDDNTLWSWGGGSPGQSQYLLGTGNTNPTNIPVQVGSSADWVSIQGGGDHVAGIRSGNTLWTWGLIANGQLGNGTTSSSGETVLSPFMVECQRALPVRLQRFAVVGKESSVLVAWETASEKNTSHFEIQRSQDGEQWDVLGTQKARGESQSLITYRFVDEYPLRGINYYRLKMMDKDNTFTYTRAQSVEMVRGTAIVYPNPVAETLYLKNVEATRVREIVLQDLRGVVFFRSSGFPTKGIDVRNMTQGTYMLTVTEQSGFAKSYKVAIGY